MSNGPNAIFTQPVYFMPLRVVVSLMARPLIENFFFPSVVSCLFFSVIGTENSMILLFAMFFFRSTLFVFCEYR